MRRKRLLFVSHTLGVGGAQRIISLLLKHVTRKEFDPFLVLFQDQFDYTVPEDVRIICLHKKGISAVPGLIWHLAQVYEKEKPDTVVSIIDYVNLIAVLAKKLSRTKPKLVLNVVNHTSTALKQGFRPRLQALAIPYLYPEANAILCLSKGVANDLVTEFRISPQKIRVIYGQVDIDFVLNQAKEEINDSNFNSRTAPIITAIGRLEVQKGYPYLLRAFAQVMAKIPCRLVIIGEGPERMALEKLTSQLKIEGQVVFLGCRANPFKYLAHSDIFVLSSLWEGFALVITEAMACGIPVISTRCPSGPDEIITDGVDGLLVPAADETALAEAILRLLYDKNLAVRLAEAAKKRAEDFASAKIIKEYEAFF